MPAHGPTGSRQTCQSTLRIWSFARQMQECTRGRSLLFLGELLARFLQGLHGGAGLFTSLSGFQLQRCLQLAEGPIQPAAHQTKALQGLLEACRELRPTAVMTVICRLNLHPAQHRHLGPRKCLPPENSGNRSAKGPQGSFAGNDAI